MPERGQHPETEKDRWKDDSRERTSKREERDKERRRESKMGLKAHTMTSTGIGTDSQGKLHDSSGREERQEKWVRRGQWRGKEK